MNPELADGPGLTHYTHASEVMRHDVGYVVWTPADYAHRPNTRYPVIYFLHGMGGNESRAAGKFTSLLTRAIAKGWMPPVIAVFPNSGRSDYREKVESMIVEELIPHIDASHRTIAKGEARGVAGLSMGGVVALWLTANHPDLFSLAGSWGGDLWHMEEEALPAVDRNHAQLETNGYAALLVNGNQDLLDAHAPLVKLLSERKIRHDLVVLKDTPHNLGLSYERAGEQMPRFIGTQLRKYQGLWQDKYDIAISGGRIVDGTGSHW